MKDEYHLSKLRSRKNPYVAKPKKSVAVCSIQAPQTLLAIKGKWQDFDEVAYEIADLEALRRSHESRKNPYVSKVNQAIAKDGLFGVGKLADTPNDPMETVIWERLRVKHRMD